MMRMVLGMVLGLLVVLRCRRLGPLRGDHWYPPGLLAPPLRFAPAPCPLHSRLMHTSDALPCRWDLHRPPPFLLPLPRPRGEVPRRWCSTPRSQEVMMIAAIMVTSMLTTMVVKMATIFGGSNEDKEEEGVTRMAQAQV